MKIDWRQNYQNYRKIFLKNYEYYKSREDIRSYLELVLNLVAISVFSLFAIKPTAITIIDLNKEIKAKEETLKKMNNKINNLQQAQAIIENKESSIKLLEESIPKEHQAEDFMRALGGVATINNLDINSISTQNIPIIGTPKEIEKSKLKLPEEIKTIHFSASFKGNFSDIIEFTKKMENFIRPIEFESTSLSKKVNETEEENTEELSLSIIMNLPYYQETSSKKEMGETRNNQEEKEDLIESE